MSDLRENLKTILEEKNVKIIPENIRYGVTILGVKGNLLPIPITLTENVTKENEEWVVSTKYMNVDSEEETVTEHKIITNKLPLYLDVTVDDILVLKNKLINVTKNSTVNIHVSKMDNLEGTFAETTELSGNIDYTKTESDKAPVIEEREEGEGNVLHTTENAWVKYDLPESITDFSLEFEFYKADTSAYPRVIGLTGLDFEIEIKGASNTIYWNTDYSGGWKQNEWNKMKFVKEGTNVSLYINDELITTKTYTKTLTGFYLGRGNNTGNFFNGYYRNLVLHINELKKVLVEVVEDGEV